MTDRSRLLFAWAVVVLSTAFEVWMWVLAWHATSLLSFVTFAALGVWLIPVAFFMAVWIRRIHKSPDVSDYPAPPELPLQPE